ncbi:hypothetical protein [Paractinoplanes rishiriensis]|uniref:Uncharacterized protein n=1 Tax=Paractinoplanes rishiriensis TaxID=1050105 RepID=A0A919JVQ7_9ACTN|nr:hypothetical protein [Actinoplanes rishiriensis]GIE94480.1 hypothetical protein Ari01nite_19450 [Actinoplanes rishiriensis]
MEPTVRLPSRLLGAEKRIPNDLAMLNGPAEGVVHLPNRLCWSGLNVFDVTDPDDRLTLYTTLLDCGQLPDVIEYMHADYLCQDWPRIRRLTSRRLIAIWESRLPELAATR